MKSRIVQLLVLLAIFAIGYVLFVPRSDSYSDTTEFVP